MSGKDDVFIGVRKGCNAKVLWQPSYVTKTKNGRWLCCDYIWNTAKPSGSEGK